MDYFQQFILFFVLVARVAKGVPFNQNYHVQWGDDHVKIIDQTQIELLLDQSSGAGIRSNEEFRSGFFRMKVKLPPNKSPGVATTFYLDSRPDSLSESTNHDELDFEFIVTNDSYVLNTNVFSNDLGEREQGFHLWFDPTVDFHNYDILWNAHQIVFFVDDTPITVFKNHTAAGLNYPLGVMHAKASLWNGTWAGDIDWSKGPFKAQYGDFTVNACRSQDGPEKCASEEFDWNKNWALDPKQKQMYDDVRKSYLVYDYCVTKPKKECELLSI